MSVCGVHVLVICMCCVYAHLKRSRWSIVSYRVYEWICVSICVWRCVWDRLFMSLNVSLCRTICRICVRVYECWNAYKRTCKCRSLYMDAYVRECMGIRVRTIFLSVCMCLSERVMYANVCVCKVYLCICCSMRVWSCVCVHGRYMCVS